MHLLQAGVNLVYIRDILGHVSILTTEIYARADSKQKERHLKPPIKMSYRLKSIPNQHGNLTSLLKNGSKALEHIHIDDSEFICLKPP